jgi:2-(1,2-epoxy-1,2-dihydrophenyl)acetyl-CoA isomerase
MTDSPDAAPILTRIEDGVGIVTLNRPHVHNAIDNALYAELDAAFLWAARTAEIRAVLIDGVGKSFCSGRDRGDIGTPPKDIALIDYVERSQTIRLHQIEIRKPVLAAIHGSVFGAGAQLALGADFRIAADTLKIGVPESGFGLVTDTGASAMLTHLAGPARAKWLMMSGEALDAVTAQAWGLVEWVVPAAELAERALTKAKTLAARPAQAMAQSKLIVDGLWLPDMRVALRQELLAQTLLMANPEMRGTRPAAS